MSNLIYHDILRFLGSKDNHYVRQISDLPGVEQMQGDERLDVFNHLMVARREGWLVYDDAAAEPSHIQLTVKRLAWYEADQAETG